MLNRFIVSAGGMLLSGLLVWVSQDDVGMEPAPLRPAEIAPQEAFMVPFSETISSISLRGVVGGSGLVYSPDGEPSKVVTLAVTCDLGQVLMEQAHQIETVGIATGDAVAVQVGPFTPGLAHAMAAELLGETDPDVLNKLIGPGPTIPTYVLSVSPSEGETWGTVSSEAQLDVSLDLSKP